MKRCTCCATEKPLGRFEWDKRRGNARSECRDCLNQKRRIQKRRDYDSKAEREKHLQRIKSPNYLQKQKEQRIKHAEKDAARTKLRHAVAEGKLEKLPCEMCGDKRSEGHHWDYSKPLDVRWYCRKHHMLQHRKRVTLKAEQVVLKFRPHLIPYRGRQIRVSEYAKLKGMTYLAAYYRTVTLPKEAALKADTSD